MEESELCTHGLVHRPWKNLVISEYSLQFHYVNITMETQIQQDPTVEDGKKRKEIGMQANMT